MLEGLLVQAPVWSVRQPVDVQELAAYMVAVQSTSSTTDSALSVRMHAPFWEWLSGPELWRPPRPD